MFLDQKLFFYKYDTDATTYKYCRFGNPWGGPTQGKYGFKTSGSSTTVTSSTTSGPQPFDQVAVGDIVVFQIPPDTSYLRTVATKTSGNSITVDTALNADPGAGSDYAGWFLYKRRIGATASDGWHNVGMWTSFSVDVDVTAVAAAGGVDMSIEVLAPGFGPTFYQVLEKNYSVVGKDSIQVLSQGPVGLISSPVQALRIGLKGHTGFAGTDAVTVWARGEMRQ